MYKAAIIGYGYWGPNLVRNFFSASRATVTHVCDLSESRLKACSQVYPSVEVTSDFDSVIKNSEVDIIAIATPVSSHFELARKALEAGKHIWVEKPFTITSDEARTLIEMADQKGLTIIVDHTFIYTGGVKKIRELIDKGEIGDIYYYDSIRVNLGLFQTDVNVACDLAVHDFSILDFLFNKNPVELSATGCAHVETHPISAAYLTLFYEDNFIAHINANWLSPVKLRQVIIGGSKRMVLFNDLENTEKVKIYDAGVDIDNSPEAAYKMRVDYRMGDMYAPKVAHEEALANEVNHFIDCIEQKKRPLTDGEMGMRVVAMLEAATKSMELNGRPVECKI